MEATAYIWVPFQVFSAFCAPLPVAADEDAGPLDPEGHCYLILPSFSHRPPTAASLIELCLWRSWQSPISAKIRSHWNSFPVMNEPSFLSNAEPLGGIINEGLSGTDTRLRLIEIPF